MKSLLLELPRWQAIRSGTCRLQLQSTLNKQTTNPSGRRVRKARSPVRTLLVQKDEHNLPFSFALSLFQSLTLRQRNK